MNGFRIFVVCGCIATLAACSGIDIFSSEQQQAFDPASVAEPIPREEAPSRYGNPPFYEVFGRRYWVQDSSAGFRQRGAASWYGPKFHGKRTSSGVPFNMYEVTAAHKSLPIPTYARVTRLDTGRSIVVKINDRGPFVDDRIIDLSYVAAAKLDMVKNGTAPVEVVALPPYQTLARNGPERFSSAPRHIAGATGEKVTYYAESVLAAGSKIHDAADFDGSAYLQIGAFSLHHSAERLRTQLTRQLDHAVILASGYDDFYKVRVGPVKNPAEVDILQRKLAALGYAETQLIFE